MNNLVQFAKQLANAWGGKTLEELRVEAEGEVTGIKFESVRADGGQRFIIILCLTDLDQIAKLEAKLDLADDNEPEDWNNVTLAELASRMVRNGGSLRFESLKDEFGRRSALALIAADPDSVSMVENLFNMPK
jgi:hypothetical protein